MNSLSFKLRNFIFGLCAIFSVNLLAAPNFLEFPISGYGPYSKIMSTVLDHDVSHDLTKVINFTGPNQYGPFGYTGSVLAFTGEFFLSPNVSPYIAAAYTCYPKANNSVQSSVWGTKLKSVYSGTSADLCLPPSSSNAGALNYDNHPGYDYGLADKNVYPAANGKIIFSKCIKTFANNSSCESYGAVAIDHDNGFITQYLHLANVYYGTAVNGVNQNVTTSTVLGISSNVGLPSNYGKHLHFEVLQRKSVPVDNANYYNRANYFIVDPYGYNTASYYADKLLSKPGCLWKVGCSY